MNEHEERQRATKAYRLAKVLLPIVLEINSTAEAVEAMPPEARAATADVAGVNVPSDRTWAVVVEIIRDQLPSHR